jgi:hypothetical protein
MHIECITRFDLSYTIRRLGAYTHAPNAAAFAGLYRALRYIATHPHRPIMYPSKDLSGYEELRVDFDSPNFKSMDLPNKPLQMADSDHARDTSTRRYIHNVVALINGVCVGQKTKQQRATALHSTHSEIIGGLQATKEAGYLQDICTFIGLENDLIRPMPVYLDSQPCIDALEANSQQRHNTSQTHCCTNPLCTRTN